MFQICEKGRRKTTRKKIAFTKSDENLIFGMWLLSGCMLSFNLKLIIRIKEYIEIFCCDENVITLMYLCDDYVRDSFNPGFCRLIDYFRENFKFNWYKNSSFNFVNF